MLVKSINCMKNVHNGSIKTKYVLHLHALPSFSGGLLISAGPEEEGDDRQITPAKIRGSISIPLRVSR